MLKFSVIACLFVASLLVASEIESNPSEPKPLGVYQVGDSILLMEMSQSGVRKAFSQQGAISVEAEGSEVHTIYSEEVEGLSKEPTGYALHVGSGPLYIGDSGVRAFAFGVNADAPIHRFWAMEFEASLGTGGGVMSSDRFALGTNLLWVPQGRVQPFLGLGALSWFEQTRLAGTFGGSGWTMGGQGLAGLRFWLTPMLSVGTRAAVILPVVSQTRARGTDLQFWGTLGLSI